jgi:hypothetical protein
MENIVNTNKKNLDLLPKIVSDYVNLPSDGLFYPSKINKVMVEYMTAADEQYLLSENYIKNNTGLELLVKNKIKDNNFIENMTVNDLLTGDLDAILLFLRRYAYGDEYPVKVRDTNGELYDDMVDLSKIEYKKLIEPEFDGNYIFTLPITKKQVVFKLLTYGEKKAIDQRLDKLNKYKGDNIFEIQERMIAQIVSIANEDDKGFIGQYVKLMPPKDSLELRKYMLEVEPGINYSYEFNGKFTGDFFRSPVTFGADFFYPRS